MDKSIKNRLDALIVQSKSLTTDESLNAFAIIWRNFLNELSNEDKKIAVTAYFQGINDSFNLIEKDVHDFAKNGSEKDRQEYAKGLSKMKELLKPKPDTVAI
jgi:glucose-6-phosphate isomerase